ncbi:SsrA-binding protein SmpB [Zavarzinia compransoris]|uniref:SsrA-binding protein n=1 Tax=Zavarzinia compransoris TaxID=1264899 RepID=A0A317E7G4_9PROT|nr:SsrA-binding protein SmpB [Zavarzinia compransoris]PWR21035.1 SsrA-binding protein [Zavarzinia compransoris]TDP44068.1 SsrA-binding protein [Zavarzinia compransoris]
MAPNNKRETAKKYIAENRKARHNYSIEDRIEAGIILKGSEVKSLRSGATNIGDSYAGANQGDGLWLYNAYIPEYKEANRENHETRRPRQLLLHKREIARLHQEVTRGGMTLVPLSMYFNDKGIAKVELGLAKGRKLHDKREAEKERDWNREKARLMKSRG